MAKIYITGHRNPDLDTLCGASAYANLKNLVDPSNEYIAVHCSPISDSVKEQMEAMGLDIPPYKKDVYPKVRDVMLTSGLNMQATDPIFDLINAYSMEMPPVIPIYEGEAFKGLLSVDDITAWFLENNKQEDRDYEFTPENIIKVIPAEMVHKGHSDTVRGRVMIGAADFDHFCNFIDNCEECIVVTGGRKEHIEYAIKKQVNAIMITAEGDVPDVDYSSFEGYIFRTNIGTTEVIRKLRLCEEVISMTEAKTETLDVEERFTEGKHIFSNSSSRGLAIMENGEFVGFVTRRCFLDMPANQVIMVDHNEPAQSIEGIETAEVVEIIDHHRLDSLSTKTPIFIAAEPLGSSCTIIYQQYLRHGIMPDQQFAKVLLTGIIADTLILRSPTTTASDISTAEMLARLARIDSIREFGEKLFSITDNLSTQDPRPMILSDFKRYENSGVKIGVGQCEVTTLDNVNEYAGEYLNELADIAGDQGLDWTLLMITDVLKEKSVLLANDYKANRDLPYKKMSKGVYSMPGVMSRKKQLLPILLAVTTV